MFNQLLGKRNAMQDATRALLENPQKPDMHRLDKNFQIICNANSSAAKAVLLDAFIAELHDYLLRQQVIPDPLILHHIRCQLAERHGCLF